MTRRLIAQPPFPTLPMGALAPKVTKVRRGRYLLYPTIADAERARASIAPTAFRWPTQAGWDNAEGRVPCRDRTIRLVGNGRHALDAPKRLLRAGEGESRSPRTCGITRSGSLCTKPGRCGRPPRPRTTEGPYLGSKTPGPILWLHSHNFHVLTLFHYYQ